MPEKAQIQIYTCWFLKVSYNAFGKGNKTVTYQTVKHTRQSYWYGCLRDVESWQEHWEHCSVLQQQTRIYVTLLIHVLIWTPPGNQGLWVYFGRLFETLSFYQSLLNCPSITIMTTVNWSSWHFLWKQWAVSFISYIANAKIYSRELLNKTCRHMPTESLDVVLGSLV